MSRFHVGRREFLFGAARAAVATSFAVASPARNLRFGLTYVDFRTQKRTIKDSGRRYANLASTGALT